MCRHLLIFGLYVNFYQLINGNLILQISSHLSAVQEKRTVSTVCDILMHSWKITT